MGARFLSTPSIRDHQPLRLPRHHRMWPILVFPHLIVPMPKHTCQKLENPIDGILMLLVPLPRCHRLLPQMLIRALELVQVGRDGRLMSLNRLYPVHDRVHVQQLIRRQCSHRAIPRHVLARRRRHMRVVARRRGLLLSLYETQQVGLSAQKVRVLKVPKLGVRIGAEHALLEMRDLVKAVHVELADKGAKVFVLEPASEDFACEALLVEDWNAGARVARYVC